MTKKLEQLGLTKHSTTDANAAAGGAGDSDNDDIPSGKQNIAIKLADAPIDFAYEVGMVPNPLEIAPLPLPVAKESLYVSKPIGKYEPYGGVSSYSYARNS